MNEAMGGIVETVEPGSLADRLGICRGDVLLQINGHPLRDVLDVQFYAADECLELTLRRGSDEIVYHVEREYGVPFGLGFSSPTFDGMRRCQNGCDFCFVAQMPHGTSGKRRLRRSLYVRDDDYRYSVLYGSFVTLTDLTPADWRRLEEQRLSPLYVSIHATEPALRNRLLGRDGVPDILPQLDRLADLGIEVHAQLVLVPGVNDGRHLVQSVTDLAHRYPHVRSIGVVPVGLTRYHRGHCRLYTPAEARSVVRQIAPLQLDYRARHGISLAYLADEWYLLAGDEVPHREAYDDYPQIENGIGLVRQFLDDSYQPRFSGGRLQFASCTLVCGTLIAPLLFGAASRLAGESGCQVDVVPVVNRMLGETVSVSGLLGGEDVLSELLGRDPRGEIVFLPQTMFAPLSAVGEPSTGFALASDSERVPAATGLRTLDELTVRDFEERLRRPVVLADRMSRVWAHLAA